MQTAKEMPGTSWQDRLIAMAHSAWILPVLFVIEVIETTILPLPYEALFIALCAAARNRIWQFVLVTTLGSAAAGAIMYGLGAQFASDVAAWFGVEDSLAELTAAFAERGRSFILLGGTTPAPSYLINVAAGASGYPFGEFLGLFSLSRFVRFAVLGAFVYFFGDDIARFWNRLPNWLRRALTVLLIVGLIYWFVSAFV